MVKLTEKKTQNYINLVNSINKLEKQNKMLFDEVIELKDKYENEYSLFWVFLSDLLKTLKEKGLITDYKTVSRFDPKQSQINSYAGPK